MHGANSIAVLLRKLTRWVCISFLPIAWMHQVVNMIMGSMIASLAEGVSLAEKASIRRSRGLTKLGPVRLRA